MRNCVSHQIKTLIQNRIYGVSLLLTHDMVTANVRLCPQASCFKIKQVLNYINRQNTE